MITAIEEQRSQHRSKSRSAASGPEFSVPSVSSIADMLSTAPLPSSSFCTRSESGSSFAPSSPASSVDLTSYLGRSIGSGQCVALVRAAQPALGPAATWAAGSAVQGNATLQPGTPIATFDSASRYANATDGSSHAALYLGQDSNGVTVLDQWAGSAASVRTLPWSNASGVAANTGSAFRVVKG